MKGDTSAETVARVRHTRHGPASELERPLSGDCLLTKAARAENREEVLGELMRGDGVEERVDARVDGEKEDEEDFRLCHADEREAEGS